MAPGWCEDDLVATLCAAQRVGALGSAPIEATIAHARRFTAALAGVAGTVMDLGSGAGVPGLVIAFDRPDLHVVLVDRRAARTDALQRVVRRYGLAAVSVVQSEAAALAADERWAAQANAVVARGFGPAPVTARLAAALVRPGGTVVISEPPAGGDRWAALDVGRWGLIRTPGPHGVAVFGRST